MFVLPSGTIIDTAEPDADQKLRSLEPEIHEGLPLLRKRVLANPESMAKIRQQYSMKNTMGWPELPGRLWDSGRRSAAPADRFRRAPLPSSLRQPTAPCQS